jgi:hypothetical protein
VLSFERRLAPRLDQILVCRLEARRLQGITRSGAGSAIISKLLVCPFPAAGPTLGVTSGQRSGYRADNEVVDGVRPFWNTPPSELFLFTRQRNLVVATQHPLDYLEIILAEAFGCTLVDRTRRNTRSARREARRGGQTMAHDQAPHDLGDLLCDRDHCQPFLSPQAPSSGRDYSDS